MFSTDIRQQEHEARGCDLAAELFHPAALLSAFVGAPHQRPQRVSPLAPRGRGGQVHP